MGKKIDRFVLTLIAAGAFYLYYRRAFRSGVLALALALVSCAVGAKLLRRLAKLAGNNRFLQRRRMRRRAGGAVMRLACLPTEEAGYRLEDLLRKSYDGDYAVDLKMCIRDRLCTVPNTP